MTTRAPRVPAWSKRTRRTLDLVTTRAVAVRRDGLVDQALATVDELTPGLEATGHDSGPVTGGEHPDPTGSTALTRHDPLTAAAHRLADTHRVQRILSEADELFADLQRVAEVGSRAPDQAAAPAGSGDCLACGEHMPGVGENRLRAGLCPTHRMGLRRSKLDRWQYIAAIRRGDQP